VARASAGGFERGCLRSIDVFVTGRVRARGTEAIARARMVVATSFATAFLLATGAAGALLRGGETTTVQALLASLALAAVPFVLRATGALTLAANVVMAILFVLIAHANLADAGNPGGPLLATTVVPLLGVLLAGTRAGVFWGILAAAQLVLLEIVRAGRLEIPADLAVAPPVLEPTYLGGATVVLAILGLALCDRALGRGRLDELDEARERAERADRVKSDFVASVSHEMRTPLNVMVGMIDMLLDSRLSDPQAGLARTLRVSTMNLLRLVNDVVDLSRIEAGRLELEAVPFDIRTCITDVAQQLDAPAREKGLGIDVVLDPAVPQAVVGDPARLRQVLLNLLGNAIKFTPQGRTGIEVYVIGKSEGEVVLSFAVTDTGVGIPKEDIPRLFQRFTQIDGAAARAFGGSGLGLAISRELVLRMDGELSVESRHGGGSRFEFRLPMRVPPATSRPALLPSSPGSNANHAVAS